jgi:hypothetical protein
MSVKDLSPKFNIPSAEKELEMAMAESMGQRSGGLSLFSDSFKRGYGNAVFGSDSNGIWLGAADYANAPFKVSMAGALTATTATITGMGKNFVSTLAWTATDQDTATWASGTIKTSDGTSYAIDAGNTGNIGATTYVYLDPATFITVLQTTTTATTAAGNGKILIAVVQIGGAGSECIIDVVGGSGTTIDGDRITTGTIVADRLSVSTLSAISADLGTVTAGDISGVTIAIGAGNSIFKADSNGIYLGNATFASAPFRVAMDGSVTANMYSLNSGNIVNHASGMIFKNTYGINYYNSANDTMIAQLKVDASNELILANTTGKTSITAGNVEGFEMATSGWVTMGYGASISGGLNIPTGNITMNTGYLSSSTSDISIASGKNLVFAGTQGSINCGSIDCDAINMNSSTLSNVNTITSGSGADITLNPYGTNKVKFEGNINLNEKDLDAGNTLWAYNFSNRSDRKLKKNITSKLNNLNQVKLLRPVSYKLKKDKLGRDYVGLVAQEVQEIMPGAVSVASDGMLGINYNEIIPILIGAIQEMEMEIDKLKNKPNNI